MRTTYFISALVIAAAIFTSCKKEETVVNSGAGYIKALECDSDLATIGNIVLGDNSIIVVCRSVDATIPGYMYRLDSKGNLLWGKRLHSKNKGCYQVYDLQGNGFAVLGYESVTDLYFTVFLYDDDGNYLSSKSVPFNIVWYSINYFSAIQMLQLSNGNFVFACNQGWLELYFTNSSFDTLYHKEISIGQYTGAFVRGIYQNTDSTIQFANAYSWLTNFVDVDYDIQLIQTDLTGNLISRDSIADSFHNETPNILLPLGNKMLLVTGRMGNFNESSGAVVNYLNNGYNSMVSADINLVQLTSGGQFISRQSIHDYPANGMIMSGRPTSDGGYILCGTVNQSDVVNLISPTKIYLMKVNEGGIFEWSKTINTTYPSFGVDAVQTSDGGYFISGYEKALNKYYNAIVIKTDANGDY